MNFIKSLKNLFKKKDGVKKPVLVSIHITPDTYEAAFYLCRGARLTDITIKKVIEKKVEKLGFRQQYFFSFTNVLRDDIENWKNETAQMNLSKFKRERLWLKKQMKKQFSPPKRNNSTSKRFKYSSTPEPHFYIKGQYYT